jgi:uncharacterized protein DUF397
VENADMTWRKSSYSTGGANNCLESASGNGLVMVRDTTDRTGVTLGFTSAAWASLVTRIKQQ